ncbi:hypothetical protein EC99P2_00001 [Enterococcus phage EC99P2]|nr:hypothetical protein EC99P2_00001 [Enterococcus phage EC99P2]
MQSVRWERKDRKGSKATPDRKDHKGQPDHKATKGIKGFKDHKDPTANPRIRIGPMLGAQTARIALQPRTLAKT